MAQATLSAIAAHLRLKYGPGAAAKQFRKHYPLIRVLPKVASTGEQASTPVEFERTDSAGSSFHTPGGDYPSENAVPRDYARWNWSEVAQTAGVDDLAAGIARSNALPGNMDLMRSEVGGAVHKIFSDLNAYAYTGDHTASPPQLAGIVTAGGTATYAGIDPTDTGYGNWQGKNAAPGAGSLGAFEDDPAPYLREKILDSIRDAGGSADFAFCGSTLISLLLKGYQQADSQTRIRLYSGIEVPVMELGARAVVVDNIAVISSESAELQYVAQPVPDPAEVAGMLREFGMDISPSVVEALLRRPLDLPPLYFEALPKTGTKQRIGIAGQMQIAWKVRRHHGVLTLAA
jgi:hypothetical protein